MDLCKLGGVAGVGKLDTLDFLIIWTPRNTNVQKNQFGQTLPTGDHKDLHYLCSSNHRTVEVNSGSGMYTLLVNTEVVCHLALLKVFKVEALDLLILLHGVAFYIYSVDIENY